jgi:hypothetical protein
VTGTTSEWTSTDIWVDSNDDGIEDTPIALSNNHLYARVRNIGGQVVSNVEVKFYYADVSTIGILGFDPNGDGDPADGNFTYIGSYRVPTLGPSGSRHAEAVAMVNWNIPVPPGTHWCVGIGIVAPDPPNSAEGNTSNNQAFKNFFNIMTSDASFEFNINPPGKEPWEAFGVEIIKKNFPKGAKIELVIDKKLEKLLTARAKGLKKLPETLLMLKGFNKEYLQILEREIKYIRYDIEGNSAILDGIVSPRGEPIPAKLIVRVPANVKVRDDTLVIVNTFVKKGEAMGGLTLKINKK